MPDEPTPDVRTVRLGLELRHIRLEQNLTLQKAHELLNRSVSSVSRIEKGQVKLPERDLPPILDAYGITDPTRRKALQALTRGPSAKDWWQSYRDVLTVYPTFISMENEAARIRAFESIFLPGLLQTAEYAREIFSVGRPERSALEIKRLTDVRIKRQQILRRTPRPDVHVILAESTLRQCVGGPEVMQRQLQHLVEVLALGRVGLQILPFTAGAHPALGSFNILTVPALGGDIVHIDETSRSRFVDDEAITGRYLDVYERLSIAALPEDDSRRQIEHLAYELQSQAKERLRQA
ncbi:helix-turn-helix domain-containing protein [Actinomadura bangladeshensis]|uniref:Helix-turn-helix domain-containing protein n=1 Tax=Actinomadura bangladeshensis TaxID=453573 RepID=A0A6L9Q9R3_9ACTN|nr:helix-turn-helix transcriptional regulator [Actinomadura bangladeshensis]NEA21935.1 helix-turn-helix domain-containing protein [Actinomadura bangladeshensis]